MAVGYSIYLKRDSFIHTKLDPRTKLVWLLVMFSLSMLFNHPLPLGVLLVLVIILGRSAQLPWKSLLPILLASVWFIILGLAIWPLYVAQGEPVFTVFGKVVTVDGLLFGFAMGLRVALMVTASGVWMMSTSPQTMMLGLLKIGMPYKVGMALSTAIRFVPLITSERITITEAQRTRGLDLERGNSFSKAIKYVGVIGPLMLRTFDLTNSLAVAMDCRGFGARDGRTSINKIGFTKADFWILASCGLLLAAGIVARITGVGVLVANYL